MRILSIYCATLCACMCHLSWSEPVTYYITECAANSHSATGIEGENCVCNTGYGRSASGYCVPLGPGGGGGGTGPQPQPTPPSGGGGRAGPTSGGGTLALARACAQAGKYCVNGVMAHCAVSSCQAEYCETHGCTPDEQRASQDASELWNVLHCDEVPACGKSAHIPSNRRQ
jgi:hypothetical protein